MRKARISEIYNSQAADLIGVSRFETAMQIKLENSREIKGKSGWNNPAHISIDYLKEQLKLHLEKGDMADVGIFAMMIWNRQHPFGVKS